MPFRAPSKVVGVICAPTYGAVQWDLSRNGLLNQTRDYKTLKDTVLKICEMHDRHGRPSTLHVENRMTSGNVDQNLRDREKLRRKALWTLVCCSRNNFSVVLATLSQSFSARGNASERLRNYPQPRSTDRTEPPSTLSHHQSARRPSRPANLAGSPRLFADRDRSFDRFLTPHDHLLVPAFSSAEIGRFARQTGSWAQNVLAG